MTEVVLRFDVERVHAKPKRADGGSAQIIIFPGVRIEQLTSGPSLSGRTQLMAAAMAKFVES